MKPGDRVRVKPKTPAFPGANVYSAYAEQTGVVLAQSRVTGYDWLVGVGGDRLSFLESELEAHDPWADE